MPRRPGSRTANDRRRRRGPVRPPRARAARHEAGGRGQGTLGGPHRGVVLALNDEPRSTRAWAIGARGEEKLAEALDGFTVLHDRRVSGTRGNIDHVVVAPAGVFVVDAKRYEGRIEIRNPGWLLRPDERLHDTPEALIA